MNKGVKRIASLFLAVVMLFSTMVVTTSAASVANVGALLDSYAKGSGTFTITEDSRIFVVSDPEPTGDLLQTAQLIQREMRAEFEKKNEGKTYFENMVWGPAEWALTGDVVLVLDADSGTGADGYKLDVTGTTATVTAADVDGLIYGVNTLMKCFRAVGGNSVSGFSAYDTPDTKERTVHLDLARKYYTAEWVKNFIRQMSWMGYNALELHLSEDGGFRANFWDSTYYKDNNGDGTKYQPTNDFSWLCGSHVQSWVKDPYRTDPNAGDYLTTEELVEICNVAKEYHIEIIPSFDSPAHMDYITWKFEQNYKSNSNYYFSYGGYDWFASSTNGCINYTGKTGASSPTWPYYTTIDITDGTMAKAFVFALYTDMADFFKEYAGSTKFNIGADEVNMTDCTPIWSYSQFPGYVNELNQMLNAKGYTVRMYNDFIGSTTYNQSNDKAVYSFDSNIEICYWTSDFQPTTGKWEEPIWHVKFFWENNTGTTDNWGDGGRTMYNCIQTNTYYVLREGTSGTHRDARDPNNRNWTFYHTNEEAIYNEWYPADISEKGVYTENAADVPDDQLGGAYFLIWNDYAALNTEKEVWNGALDCYDKDRYYYLFDIMASNIIKMWNADINSSVTYSDFSKVRDATLEWFPGFTSCSAAASLPVATAPVEAQEYRADHSALEAALANKISNDDGTYTDDSYAAYETAYAAAEAVNADKEATEAEIAAAITNLTAAKEALVKNTTGDGDDDDGGNTGDGGNTDSTVNTPTLSTSFTKAYLKTLIRNAFTSAPFNIDSEADCWKGYSDAVTAANNAIKNNSGINEAVLGLLNAENALVTTETPKIIDVAKVSSNANGSYVTLKVVTTGGAPAVAVEGYTNSAIIAQGKLQQLKNGSIVKVWLVKIPVDFKGEYGIEYDGTTLVINH